MEGSTRADRTRVTPVSHHPPVRTPKGASNTFLSCLSHSPQPPNPSLFSSLPPAGRHSGPAVSTFASQKEGSEPPGVTLKRRAHRDVSPHRVLTRRVPRGSNHKTRLTVIPPVLDPNQPSAPVHLPAIHLLFIPLLNSFIIPLNLTFTRSFQNPLAC